MTMPELDVSAGCANELAETNKQTTEQNQPAMTFGVITANPLRDYIARMS
jgi:hypothetical protein